MDGKRESYLNVCWSTSKNSIGMSIDIFVEHVPGLASPWGRGMRSGIFGRRTTDLLPLLPRRYLFPLTGCPIWSWISAMGRCGKQSLWTNQPYSVHILPSANNLYVLSRWTLRESKLGWAYWKFLISVHNLYTPVPVTTRDSDDSGC